MSTADPFAPGFPNLLRQHYEALRNGSGINDDVIRDRGYRSVLGRAEPKKLGFSAAQQRTPALLVPVWAPDGSNGLYQLRPDSPRAGRDGRVIKYETPTGAGMRLDCPPSCRPMLSDPTIPLWITEGVKKADALASHGLCAIALLGVWNWKGTNPQGGTVWLADWDYVALKGREIRIVFDSDVTAKPEVQVALDRLVEHLRRKV